MHLMYREVCGPDSERDTMSNLRRFVGTVMLTAVPLLGLAGLSMADPSPVGPGPVGPGPVGPSPVGPVGGCPGGMNWDPAINQCVATPILGPAGVGPVGPGPVGPGV